MSKQIVHFMPLTELGRTMLLSIPRKVGPWVQLLTTRRLALDNETTDLNWRIGTYGDLTWSFMNTQVRMSQISIVGVQQFDLYWEGTDMNMYTPRGSEEWLKDIENNLDKFISLEKRIYDELERYQAQLDELEDKKLERERNLQALQAD